MSLDPVLSSSKTLVKFIDFQCFMVSQAPVYDDVQEDLAAFTMNWSKCSDDTSSGNLQRKESNYASVGSIFSDSVTGKIISSLCRQPCVSTPSQPWKGTSVGEKDLNGNSPDWLRSAALLTSWKM